MMRFYNNHLLVNALQDVHARSVDFAPLIPDDQALPTTESPWQRFTRVANSVPLSIAFPCDSLGARVGVEWFSWA